MESQSPSTTPGGEKPRRKKRAQYKRMSDAKKRDLIFRVLYLNENVRSTCHELGFNFSTGRNLIQKYKKTGEYDSQPKVPVLPTGEKAPSTNQTDGDGKKCALGLVMVADGQLKIVPSRTYNTEEEDGFRRLHGFFVGRSIA